MIRKSSVLAAAVALVLVAPIAHAAGWTIGVNGGLGKATGDFGKDSKVGPVAGVEIDMHVNPKIAVGVEGNWSRNKHKDVGVLFTDPSTGDTDILNKDNINILSGLVHAKYMFPVSEASKVSPYALLGVGGYNAKEDFEETFTPSGGSAIVITDENTNTKGSTRLGGKIGAGAVYKATEQVGIMFGGDFNIVSLDTNGAPSGTPSTFKFWTVRAGLNFNVMPK